MGSCQYLCCFCLSPCLQCFGAHIAHAAKTSKNRQHRIIIGHFNCHRKVVFTQRIEQLHFSTNLLNHRMRGFYSIRRLRDVSYALFSPISKHNKRSQNIHQFIIRTFQTKYLSVYNYFKRATDVKQDLLFLLFKIFSQIKIRWSFLRRSVDRKLLSVERGFRNTYTESRLPLL